MKLWTILGSVSLLTVSFIYIFSRPKKQKQQSGFKKKLVNLANEEHNAWNKNGTVKEGNQDTIQRLRN